jgi:hypothetical protein
VVRIASVVGFGGDVSGRSWTRGWLERLPSRSLRVGVYAGIDCHLSRKVARLATQPALVDGTSSGATEEPAHAHCRVATVPLKPPGSPLDAARVPDRLQLSRQQLSLTCRLAREWLGYIFEPDSPSYAKVNEIIEYEKDHGLVS